MTAKKLQITQALALTLIEHVMYLEMRCDRQRKLLVAARACILIGVRGFLACNLLARAHVFVQK